MYIKEIRNHWSLKEIDDFKTYNFTFRFIPLYYFPMILCNMAFIGLESG